MSVDKARELMSLVNAAVGGNAVRMASDEGLKVTYTSTGLLPFDLLLGGGMPRGRFVEVYGDFATLKSYLGLRSIASYQQSGGVCAVIDTERTFEPKWAQEAGVDTDALIVWPPRDDHDIHTGEEAIDVTQALLKGGVSFVVFDSVAAMLPQDESKKRLHAETVQPARLASLMSLAMRKLTASNGQGTVLWVNQTRVNVGVVFGTNEAIPGGKALSFYATYRVRLRRHEYLTSPERVFTGDGWKVVKKRVGVRYAAELTKSKLGSPAREVVFVWDYGSKSVDVADFLFTQAVTHGLVTQKGSVWECAGAKYRGKDSLLRTIRNEPTLALDLERRIREREGLPPSTLDGDHGRGSKKVSTRRPLTRKR